MKNISSWHITVFMVIALLCIAVSTRAATYEVSTLSELHAAVNAANNAGTPTTILLNDGTYNLAAHNPPYLQVTANNVTIHGKSGNREQVIIQGDRMAEDAETTDIFLVSGDHFHLSDVTLQKCRWHAVQIQGDADADYPVIRNCIIRDTYEQMIKVSYNFSTPFIGSEGGLVEGCLFEYTAGIGPQYYIGGIDALYAHNWIVRSNTFRSIISPGGDIAQHAICFWHNSSGTLVDGNLIINCDRGIGFGIGYDGHYGGIIRNNMIYHDAASGDFADAAIILDSSPNTWVYNNTCYMENDLPWTIEYRFAGTTNGYIANNLVNKQILSRDDGVATVYNNVTSAQASWFVDVSAGDLHLAYQVGNVVDEGVAITGLVHDFDGNPRPQGYAVDIGADEYTIGHPGSVAVIGDFDGDGNDDLACYQANGGLWTGLNSDDGAWNTQFGFANTVPLVGDMDNDTQDDYGCYYASGGNWYIRQSTAAVQQLQCGFGGTIPVIGDFDGDGNTDYGCYHPDSGMWYLMQTTSGFKSQQFGYGGTIPLLYDMDNDGQDDFIIYYPPGGYWYALRSTAGLWMTQFGFSGTTPLIGDFDGDNQFDYGCYYPPTGMWYFQYSSSGFTSRQFGFADTQAVIGDFDGDDISDYGCFYAPNGSWYLIQSSSGFRQEQF